MEKLFYTVNEFHELLGGSVTKSFIYKMIDKGEITIRKFGNKILIPAAWVKEFISEPGTRVRKVCKKEKVS